MSLKAVVSTEISNTYASPVVVNDNRQDHGVVHCKSGTIAWGANDLDNSIYRLCRLRAHDSVKSIRIFHDIANTTFTFDLGIFPQTQSASVVVADATDPDAYASAHTHTTADTTGLEHAFEARNITAINQRVWEDAGVATDPGNIWYELVISLTAALNSTLGGDLSFVVLYTSGD